MKRKILWLGLSFLLVAALVLASCGPAEEEEAVVDPYEEYVAGLAAGEFPVPREAFEQAIEEGELYLYEWAGWWPEEIHEGFSEEFGIEITRDYFASGGERLTKFRLNPEVPYDLLPATGDTGDLLAVQEAGAIGQLNPDWIPNVLEYIPEEYLLEGSIAYYVSVRTYIINTKYVDDPRIPSWAVLFEPMEEIKGRVVLYNEMVDTIGNVLMYLGYSYFSDDEAELMEAGDLLMELKPYILAFDSWPKTALLGDEVWIINLPLGDSWSLHDEYEALVPVLPAGGTVVIPVWTSHMKGSPNPAAAHLFLNYLFRPEVMALLIEQIQYPPIHTALPELLSEEVLERQALPEGYLDKCEIATPELFRKAYTGRGLELRLEIWEEVKG